MIIGLTVAISVEVMIKIMEGVERDWNRSELEMKKRFYARAGLFFIVCFMASL